MPRQKPRPPVHPDDATEKLALIKLAPQPGEPLDDSDYEETVLWTEAGEPDGFNHPEYVIPKRTPLSREDSWPQCEDRYRQYHAPSDSRRDSAPFVDVNDPHRPEEAYEHPSVPRYRRSRSTGYHHHYLPPTHHIPPPGQYYGYIHHPPQPHPPQPHPPQPHAASHYSTPYQSQQPYQAPYYREKEPNEWIYPQHVAGEDLRKGFENYPPRKEHRTRNSHSARGPGVYDGHRDRPEVIREEHYHGDHERETQRRGDDHRQSGNRHYRDSARYYDEEQHPGPSQRRGSDYSHEHQRESHRRHQSRPAVPGERYPEPPRRQPDQRRGSRDEEFDLRERQRSAGGPQGSRDSRHEDSRSNRKPRIVNVIKTRDPALQITYCDGLIGSDFQIPNTTSDPAFANVLFASISLWSNDQGVHLLDNDFWSIEIILKIWSDVAYFYHNWTLGKQGVRIDARLLTILLQYRAIWQEKYKGDSVGLRTMDRIVENEFTHIYQGLRTWVSNSFPKENTHHHRIVETFAQLTWYETVRRYDSKGHIRFFRQRIKSTFSYGNRRDDGVIQVGHVLNNIAAVTDKVMHDIRDTHNMDVFAGMFGYLVELWKDEKRGSSMPMPDLRGSRRMVCILGDLLACIKDAKEKMPLLECGKHRLRVLSELERLRDHFRGISGD